MRARPLSRNRDYMLLWGGEVLSELGSQSSTVAYPLLILSLTGSPAKAGLVGLAKWLPLAVFALPAGALADRFDRKRLMIVSDAVRLLGAASIVGMLILGSPPFAQVMIVAFLDGSLSVVSFIAERGALAQLVPGAQLQDAVTQNDARSFAAGIVGPPLGGLLFGIARALPFAADAVSFLCSTTAVSLIRSRFQEARGARQPRTVTLRAEVTEGFAWLWRQPFYRLAACLFAFGNPIFTGLYLLAILLARNHGASPSEIGVMFAIVGVGGVLGAVVAPRLRRMMGVRTMIVGEYWLMVLLVLALWPVHSAILIGLLVGATEFTTPVTNSVVSGSRIAATPDHLRGRVQAASTTLAASLAWLGPVAIGFAFEHAGADATILILAGWTLVLATVAALAPSLRTGPPAPAAFATPDT
jgi:MFS family permease